MVDKDMFQSMLLDEFYKQMPDDFILSVKDVFKENDTKMTGININREGSSGGCVLYVENLYDRYQQGEDLSSMVSDVLQEVTKSEIYSMDTSSFTRDDMLAHTTFRMANKYTNQLRLSDVPTRDVPGMTDIVIYVDLGRGRVDYLNFLKLSGSHIAHLKRHVDLLKVCDAAKHLAPGTEYGMQYEDNVQEWAGFCRETLNHFSENPIVPRPPELKSNESIVSKDWRLAL